MSHCTRKAILYGIAALLTAGSSIAQSPPALYPRFELEYVEPHVHKWYEPRHLPETYWRPWYSGATSYARQPYSRYVNRLLEGDDFYDVFGQPIGRGWLVYTWTQSQPQASGSQLFKRPPEDPRNRSEPRPNNVNAYERFFTSQLSPETSIVHIVSAEVGMPSTRA